MKIKNVALTNLRGEVIKQAAAPGADEVVLTVATVLTDVALAPPPPGQSYQPSRAAERFKFAQAIVNTAIDEEFEVPAALVQDLDNDVARFYPVVVSGYIHELLK